MRISKLTGVVIVLVMIINWSCTDPAIVFSDWKQKNEAYFSNMKDSSNYNLCTLPDTLGGYKFYYKIIEPGDSLSNYPLPSSSVTINYRGSLIDGTVFDQTYTGTTPIGDYNTKPKIFRVNHTILGMYKNLETMKTGEIRTIIVPQELGYCIDGLGDIIRPYSTLRFDIQLISVTNQTMVFD